jgi:hypothetical protein
MEVIYDTIRLELKIQAVLMDPHIWMQGDIEIFINREKPYLDGDIVDAELLIKSLKSSGNYFIFSCCCGLPECSKWIKPIKVEHEENMIKWIEPNTENTWHFDKHKLEEDMENVEAELRLFKKFFKKKRIEYVGFGYNLR